ncbi:MAG: IclR family transcriptional regulator [Halanaeroarchaeum sp.]
MSRSPNRVNALDKAFDVVEALKELDGARVTTVADHLGYPQSTVHNHLTTMQDRGFVTKEGDTYHAGLKWVEIGGYVATRKDEYTLAVEKAREIAEETGERAQFIVEQGGKGIYVGTETGEKAVQVDARVGKRTHLHASAAGKALLAALPGERVDEIVADPGLEPLTENTITDRDELESELETIRERGFGLNDEESIEGLRAVGTAITGADGTVMGALSVSGPSSRMDGAKFTEDVPELLAEVSNELELELKYE